MISLKTIRSRHFILLISSNSSKFTNPSSLPQRPFSRSSQSSPADEKIRSFIRRIISVEERTDETNRAAADNAGRISEERSVGDGLRNLGEEIRDLRRETVGNTEPSSEKTGPNIAAKMGKGHFDSKVAPRKEKRVLSALFRDLSSKRPEMVENMESLSAKTDSIVASKMEKGHSDSEVATRKKKRILFVLLKGERKEQSKSKSKLAPVELTAYGVEDRTILRELSSDMKMFAEHLYAKGYLKNATFMPQDSFHPTCFEFSYSREFLRFVAVKFGNNHPDIASLLSAGDLKKVVLFGCPSLAQRVVFAAKDLRSFFEINEVKVCEACTLKKLCKHRYKSTKKHSSKLNLGNVMKVLVMYALESVPQKLVVPEDVRDSVSRLLKEITSLSQETPKAPETP